MTPTPHPSNNFTLHRPDNMTAQECGDLKGTAQLVEGLQCIVTYWTPDSAELARIKNGHPIALVVLGPMHPPVIVTVEGDSRL